MRDFILDAHAVWQYVALLSVVVSLVLSFLAAMSSESKMLVYRVTGMAVGIQVLLGIALWIFSEGWSLGFMQGWLHPIIGIAAVGVVNDFVGRARKAEPSETDRVMRTGLIIAVVLVVAAIGIGEMA
jgi:asparagine N-glycosylation enzyme membrane subunit Stt3